MNNPIFEPKETNDFKLTVTADKSRISIKVPQNYYEPDKQDILDFMVSAAEQINYPSATLRGRYDEKRSSLLMKCGRTEKHKRYVFKREGNTAIKTFDYSENANQ